MNLRRNKTPWLIVASALVVTPRACRTNAAENALSERPAPRNQVSDARNGAFDSSWVRIEVRNACADSILRSFGSAQDTMIPGDPFPKCSDTIVVAGQIAPPNIGTRPSLVIAIVESDVYVSRPAVQVNDVTLSPDLMERNAIPLRVERSYVVLDTVLTKATALLHTADVRLSLWEIHPILRRKFASDFIPTRVCTTLTALVSEVGAATDKPAQTIRVGRGTGCVHVRPPPE